jgi:hypothetical protein
MFIKEPHINWSKNNASTCDDCLIRYIYTLNDGTRCGSALAVEFFAE